jgi:hypothetical protein
VVALGCLLATILLLHSFGGVKGHSRPTSERRTSPTTTGQPTSSTTVATGSTPSTTESEGGSAGTQPASPVQSTSTTSTTPRLEPPAEVHPSLALPIRAAFYYPWYPEAWNQQGIDPFTQYHPSLGLYSSNSAAVVAEQIRAMQYGNVEAGIASWWGQGSLTDQAVPMLLQEAQRTGFQWTLYYEAAGNPVPGEAGSPNPTVSQIASDLKYIDDRYAGNPSYLHVAGKPVIFVYGAASDDCDTVAQWNHANTMGFYINFKVFPGYAACVSRVDGWHQYDPAVADDFQPGYSFSVSPGFNKANEAAPRLGRDPSTFAADVEQMTASRAPWQLITTFNEWGEGTAVEDAAEWSSSSGEGTYLDILHDDP